MPKPATDKEKIKVTLHMARMALSRLSGRMDRAGDRRRYGVNCACSVLDALAKGATLDEAVASIEVPGG